NLVPFMWAFLVLFCVGIALISYPKTRKGSDLWLGLGCMSIFVSFWLDKGIGFVLGGFVPTPVDEIVEYYPSINELFITIGIWATGFFILTILYKIAISVEHEIEA
ncbi:MAG: menaquinol oxidoreductase, partial [Desulfobulbus sp.]